VELRKLAGWDQGQVILLGGSTHPGEEKILADIVNELKGRYSQLRLMLVPRHVERTDSILGELEGVGLRVVRRSRLEREGKTDPDILLVDTTGELRDLYPTADVVFIGKTLTGAGGQNFLEAARHGRAIVAGPHMENFMPLRREFEEKRAILIAGSAEDLRVEKEEKVVENQEVAGLVAEDPAKGSLKAGREGHQQGLKEKNIVAPNL
jgi:3-deoxy-D-manno-octulosonic-acid transferase